LVNGSTQIDEWVQAVAAALATEPTPPGAETPPRSGTDGAALARAASFAARTSASYQDLTTPAEAALDLAQLEQLVPEPDWPGDDGGTRADPFGGPHRFAVRPGPGGPPGQFRLRRYGYSGVELTSFLPILESFGLVVVEAIPHRVAPAPATNGPGGPSGGAGQPAAHIDDFGLRTAAPFDPVVGGDRLIEGLEAIASGRSEIDSLNRLVTVAGLNWRQAWVLRTYRRYWRQASTAFTDAQLEAPLVAFPAVARALISYFECRFHPDASFRGAVAPAQAMCVATLERVPHLEQDQVLRGYLRLIDATVRASYYLPDRQPDRPPTLTLKFDSAAVPELPAPRPRVETFVSGPGVEGIHLRAGLVARGGVRWSERPDDFRTEVLDLALAQVKKNAIIVPTGAKAGFVWRSTGGPAGAPAPTPSAADVRDAYETFVRSLLDITDNWVGGEVVTPPGVVAYDGPDPYLVVAADKGTATFSDLANALSAEHHFWLGDAFASGGSHGYDHKAMGITARGAWVAVRRHFHQLGIDVQSEPIRLVGVGDMSGDVFGNGMLQSAAVRLVAAFDHRHIFVDPEPDPAASYEERRRLASLSHSSWADYNPAVISPGGGVWPRDVKSIPMSTEARRALGLTVTEISPPELISAILAAPVDLLWFGGIGTYIKAPDEADADVADHANDAVRITADRVRARVIAEGGNLGITQRARIRFSRRGGRINTDFIDNAAGVATSDREVNLKILLALAIEQGRLELSRRDGYLARSEEDVAADVLRQVDHSFATLNRAVAASARHLDAYEAMLEALEDSAGLDRDVEALPNAEELAVRRVAGAGLIRPELAVLMAYAKSDLVAAIEDSSLVKDPALVDAVRAYFPPPIRKDFDQLIPQHRLYPQLLATDVAGELVDQMGIIWAHETTAELGRSLPEVAGAFWAAREVLGAAELWAELEEQASSLPADAETALHAAVAGAVGRLARSYLVRPGPVHPTARIESDRAAAATAAPVSGGAAKEHEDTLVALGAPRELATRVVMVATLAAIGDAVEVAQATKRPVHEALEGLLLVERAGGGDRLMAGIAEAPTPSRWSAWQAQALMDDVWAWRRDATAAALLPPGSVEHAVAAWEAARASSIREANRLIDRMAAAGVSSQGAPDGGGGSGAPRGAASADDVLVMAALVVRRLARAG
jgi:glutamate dehydrogenase